MPLTFKLGLPFFTQHEGSFKLSLFLQFLILFFTAMILDQGEVGHFTLLAATAYWCAVAIIMIRRNGHATRLDSFLIKWGYPLALPLTAIMCAIIPMGLLRH